MVVATAAGVVLVTVLVWAVLVPRVRIDDPEAPELAPLVTPRSIVAVGGAGMAASLSLALVPAAHLWVWAPYLAFGLPLVAVDLRTTFLPRRLNSLALAAMAAGSLALLPAEPGAVLGAALGAAAAFGFFYVAWRISASLGFGDVRLALLAGAVSGLGGVGAWVTALCCATGLGALHALAHAAWTRATGREPRPFPYGPALWLGPVLGLTISAG